jgi:hypothetical protein
MGIPFLQIFPGTTLAFYNGGAEFLLTLYMEPAFSYLL